MNVPNKVVVKNVVTLIMMDCVCFVELLKGWSSRKEQT
jgi:hypothetical protein